MNSTSVEKEADIIDIQLCCNFYTNIKKGMNQKFRN